MILGTLRLDVAAPLTTLSESRATKWLAITVTRTEPHRRIVSLGIGAFVAYMRIEEAKDKAEDKMELIAVSGLQVNSQSVALDQDGSIQ